MVECISFATCAPVSACRQREFLRDDEASLSAQKRSQGWMINLAMVTAFRISMGLYRVARKANPFPKGIRSDLQLS